MSAISWIVILCAGASAGAYCGAIAASIAGRRQTARIPFAGLLAATALFGFSRVFAGSAAIAVLSIVFAAIALLQILFARGAPPVQRVLAALPVAAMAIVSLGSLSGTADAYQAATAAVLCAPIAATACSALWNLHLIRKGALNRIA
ncbi:MAG TPA: hypothetical protein VGZ02_15190 [Candidatus Baltobacteraceae bacterium]|jgi:hypothetical protein|nr:hypothetical protein [Candidatus Baltobacteraceae bacterium]